MPLRGWIKRLERASREEFIEIPQEDGSVARFPQSAARDAFLNMMERLGAGEGAPPEHPLLEAARNSSDPKWSIGSVYSCGDPQQWISPVEDLSE